MELLLLVQLAINNKILITTKESLFRANHGIDSNLDYILEKTSQTIKQFNEIWRHLLTSWKKSKDFTSQKDKKRKNFS